MSNAAIKASAPPIEGSRLDPFDKSSYMALYMTDRREADRLGFGGSRSTNPNYLTVKEFRARRAEKNV